MIPSAAMHRTLRTLFACVALSTVFLACTDSIDPEFVEPDENPAALVVTADDGVGIHYETRGTGPRSLVFVHGWSCDRSYWSGQLDAFAGEFQIVAVDLGGHGESGLGRDRWTIESFGADVVSVLDALEVENAIVIGHSMGGDVALQAALQSPARVGGVVMVDTYQQLGTPRTAEQVQEFVDQFRDDFETSVHAFVRDALFLPDADPSLADRVAADMASAPPEVALQALESSLTHGRTVTSVIEQLSARVLAINPDVPSNDVESMKRHGVDVVSMPDVGHFLMMEDPDGFNALLRSAVDEFF